MDWVFVLTSSTALCYKCILITRIALVGCYLDTKTSTQILVLQKTSVSVKVCTAVNVSNLRNCSYRITIQSKNWKQLGKKIWCRVVAIKWECCLCECFWLKDFLTGRKPISKEGICAATKRAWYCILRKRYYSIVAEKLSRPELFESHLDIIIVNNWHYQV